jgi:hypothetical protein
MGLREVDAARTCSACERNERRSPHGPFLVAAAATA